MLHSDKGPVSSSPSSTARRRSPPVAAPTGESTGGLLDIRFQGKVAERRRSDAARVSCWRRTACAGVWRCEWRQGTASVGCRRVPVPADSARCRWRTATTTTKKQELENSWTSPQCREAPSVSLSRNHQINSMPLDTDNPLLTCFFVIFTPAHGSMHHMYWDFCMSKLSSL